MGAKDFFVMSGLIILPLITGAIGAIFTFDAIPVWYESLNKPFFNPPNWLFGYVWLSLYVLMGISACLVWKRGSWKKDVNLMPALLTFFIQLVLNALWSIIFFGFKAVGIAYIEIIVLLIFILAMIMQFYRISRGAAYLQMPYLFWVSFAAFLNFSIWLLN